MDSHTRPVLLFGFINIFSFGRPGDYMLKGQGVGFSGPKVTRQTSRNLKPIPIFVAISLLIVLKSIFTKLGNNQMLALRYLFNVETPAEFQANLKAC